MRKVIGMLGALALAAACSKGGDGGDGGSAKGMIAVNGKPRTAKRCAVAGGGAEQTLRITLDDDSVVRVPVHEGVVYFSPDGKDRGEQLECEKAVARGSGSDTHYKGSITRSCAAGEARVEISVEVDCGSAGPSNEK